MKKLILTLALACTLFTGCHRSTPRDGMLIDAIHIQEEYEIDDVGVIIYEDPENNFETMSICLELDSYWELVDMIRQDFFPQAHLEQIGVTMDKTPVFKLTGIIKN